MEAAKIRLANVEQIITSRCDGVKAQFAREIQKEPQFIARWWAVSESQRRNIGSNIARHIENIFDLPSGWLDQLHDNANDLEVNPKKRAALRIASGDTHTVTLRKAAIVDQRLRLTFIDELKGNLMLLSTDSDAYAIQLQGHNPIIWLHNRWLIVVEPNTPIAPDECLLLTLKTGEILLRLLVHDSPLQMAVRNPATGEQEVILHDQITKAEYAYIGIPPSKVAPTD